METMTKSDERAISLVTRARHRQDLALTAYRLGDRDRADRLLCLAAEDLRAAGWMLVEGADLGLRGGVA